MRHGERRIMVACDQGQAKVGQMCNYCNYSSFSGSERRVCRLGFTFKLSLSLIDKRSMDNVQVGDRERDFIAAHDCGIKQHKQSMRWRVSPVTMMLCAVASAVSVCVSLAAISESPTVSLIGCRRTSCALALRMPSPLAEKNMACT
jgi:hypothetical protein